MDTSLECSHRRSGLIRAGFGMAAVGALCVSLGGFVGCADESVGHSKTTTKTTVDTPTERRTTTETREKDTRVVPP